MEVGEILNDWDPSWKVSNVDELRWHPDELKFQLTWHGKTGWRQQKITKQLNWTLNQSKSWNWSWFWSQETWSNSQTALVVGLSSPRVLGTSAFAEAGRCSTSEGWNGVGAGGIPKWHHQAMIAQLGGCFYLWILWILLNHFHPCRLLHGSTGNRHLPFRCFFAAQNFMLRLLCHVREITGL